MEPQLKNHVFSRLLLAASLLAIVCFSKQVNAEAKLYFVHNDHLGTPVAVTDENQDVVWEVQKLPFGETQVSGSIRFDARFPGQLFDEETTYHYNYFRDFDPRLGRYIQSDPIGLAGGLNTYAYAYQNPNRYTDRKGLVPAVAVACAAYPPACYAALAAATYALYQATSIISEAVSDALDNDDLPPFWPNHPDAIPIPDDPAVPNEDDSREEYCREHCSKVALPSFDDGYRYWNCYNECMEEDEWCE
ncbi:MAG: RHS repeat-associated core domain-containing protein [Pseudomonadota bacterium]